MKLYIGAVPEDPSFYPEAEGWRAIKEPGPAALQLIAIPIALVTGVLLLGALFLILPRHLYPAESITLRISIWQLILALLFIPIHELLHALCTPKFGMTDQTLIGVWPKQGLFYAYYTGELSRLRFLVTFLIPFVVLSIGPLLIIAAARFAPLNPDLLTFLVMVSLLNGMASSGDLFGAGLLLFQTPPHSIIRNQGWRTYWKMPRA